MSLIGKVRNCDYNYHPLLKLGRVDNNNNNNSKNFFLTTFNMIFYSIMENSFQKK